MRTDELLYIAYRLAGKIRHRADNRLRISENAHLFLLVVELERKTFAYSRLLDFAHRSFHGEQVIQPAAQSEHGYHYTYYYAHENFDDAFTHKSPPLFDLCHQTFEIDFFRNEAVQEVVIHNEFGNDGVFEEVVDGFHERERRKNL